MIVPVTGTDREAIRGCLLEVRSGILKEDLTEDLRANMDAIRRLFSKVKEADERQADRLELSVNELRLIVRCMQFTMTELDADEFFNRVGPPLEEAARSLEKLEAALATGRGSVR